MCSSLIQCFSYVASLGPRSMGSIGDLLLRPTYGEETKYRIRFYVRWIYEVSVFFIINIIFLKLILGIILDTFGGSSPLTQSCARRSTRSSTTRTTSVTSATWSATR